MALENNAQEERGLKKMKETKISLLEWNKPYENYKTGRV